VKLLIDENLSFRLVASLSPRYPGTTHVADAALAGASDDAVWDYAREHGFIVVSKDNHFRQRGFVEGPPPKVVWLDVGNAGTEAIAEFMLRAHDRFAAFEEDTDASLLVLPLP
jgi:predicted nuclease of predicted toxin-antitoxin system